MPGMRPREENKPLGCVKRAHVDGEDGRKLVATPAASVNGGKDKTGILKGRNHAVTHPPA